MDPTHLLAIATLLIENTGLKEALAEIDARPLPELVRVYHIHELLEAVFPKLWDQLALHEQAGEQGAAAMRQGLFAALVLVARAKGGARRHDLAWTRFGEQQTDRSPAESSERDVGYALVYDPSREAAVYISGSSRGTFGQTWEWRDSTWRARPVIEHAIPEPHKQGFCGFHDPSRAGIACWTLVAHQPGDFERYQPFGLLERGDRVEVIAAGDPPIVPSQLLFVFGAIFGVDPASGDTIMLARDALYALRGGRWLALCALDPSATSHEWRPGTRASFTHQGQLYFYWTDTDNFSRRGRLARFTGDGLQEVKAANQPGLGWDASLSEATGARFLHDGVAWRLTGAGDQLTWQRVESAPTLPKFQGAWGTVLPGGEVLVGPGEYADRSGEPRYQRCFLHADGDRLTQLGEILEGVGRCPAERTLLAHDDQVLAVHVDGRVDRVRGGADERLAEPLPATTFVLAGVCLDDAGRVTAVAADASVWQLGPDGWRRASDPDAEVAAWTLRCCAWDPPRHRMVVWGFHGDPESRLAERTAVWAEGRWTRLEAGSTLPAGERYLRAQLDNQLVFDTQHQEIVFAGANSLCVLSGDRWHPSKPEANIYRGASSGSALLVHDEASGTTLFLDTKDGWCARLDGGQLQMAARLRSPPDRLATSAGDAQARRAAMVYVPASRSVIIYASGASYREIWELPLAEVFAASPPPGERQAFPRSEPSEQRFTGPPTRRLEDGPATPSTSSSDAPIRFRRFGEEPPADWTLPTQTAEELWLIFDGLRQRLVLVRTGTDTIECWHRTGEGWQLLHRSEHRGLWGATLRLSSDPRRGAVLWLVNEEHGSAGYRITDQGLEPIKTSSDGPVRSEPYDHRDKVAFVWDRRERRLLGFSTEGLWALSDEDRWSRLATWNGATPLHQVDSFRKSDGGAWDAVAERLVLWKVDYSDGLRCWAVTAAGISPIEEAHLPEARACLLAESEHGLLLYDGGARALFRLETSGWVGLEAGQDAPELETMSDTVIACHGDGVIDLANRRPFRFHTREHARWRALGQPLTTTRPRGVARLGRHHGRLLATDGLDAWLLDGDHWQRLPSLMESFAAAPWRSEVGFGAAMTCITNDDGPARVLCDSGVVGQLSELGWELQRPSGDLPNREGYYSRVAAHNPTDSSWLMMMRGSEDAVTFRGTRDGCWEEVGRLPFSEGLSAYTTRHLIFDTRLACFVLAGDDGVFHLRDGAWARAHLDHLPRFDKLVHDPQTGASLLLDLSKGGVHRLGASSCTELHGTLAPPLPTRQRAVRGLPVGSECLDDLSERRLIWFDNEDVWGNYELDLTTFLEQARALAALDP